jgi:uncharacterized protein (DUF433 family)
MEDKLIGCRKNISFGMPTLKGRRLTVYDIVTKLFYEDTIEEAIEDYGISLLEAKSAIEYCMNLNCQTDIDRIHYCDGCVLRTIEEKWKFKGEDYIQIDEQLTVSKDGKTVFLGKIDELEEEQFGKPGWVIASEIYPKLIW